MSKSNRGGSAVTEMELSKIKIPTMIVAHRADKCKHTPPEGVEEIKSKLTNSPKVEVKYFTGGKTPRSGSCKALSAHGFLGIEDEVVSDIVNFIKTH